MLHFWQFVFFQSQIFLNNGEMKVNSMTLSVCFEMAAFTWNGIFLLQKMCACTLLCMAHCSSFMAFQPTKAKVHWDFASDNLTHRKLNFCSMQSYKFAAATWSNVRFLKHNSMAGKVAKFSFSMHTKCNFCFWFSKWQFLIVGFNVFAAFQSTCKQSCGEINVRFFYCKWFVQIEESNLGIVN